jgi:hypothetical protein
MTVPWACRACGSRMARPGDGYVLHARDDVPPRVWPRTLAELRRSGFTIVRLCARCRARGVGLRGLPPLAPAAAAATAPRPCPGCGSAFTPYRSAQLYCSSGCRRRAAARRTTARRHGEGAAA